MIRIAQMSLTLLVAACITDNIPIAESAGKDFRPPAVPLVTYNPFLSIWSEADHLNDATTKHWTRHDHSLVSLIRIDGKTYRLMGAQPKTMPAFAQKSVEVLPTRSIYEFEDAGVHVTMTFMQPALPEDLDVYSRPLSYITWTVPLLRWREAQDRTLRRHEFATGRQPHHGACRVVAPRDERSDAVVRGHAGTEGSRLLRRRSPHQLGLRLCRRAVPAFDVGDRRQRGPGNCLCRKWRSARG